MCTIYEIKFNIKVINVQKQMFINNICYDFFEDIVLSTIQNYLHFALLHTTSDKSTFFYNQAYGFQQFIIIFVNVKFNLN